MSYKEMAKSLTKRKKWCLFAGILVVLLASGVGFAGYLQYEKRMDSPALQAKRYEELKEKYPVFDGFWLGRELIDYTRVPEEGYLEDACKTSDMAVYAHVTKGNEEIAKPWIVNRIKTDPLATEEDYSLEDIIKVLLQDPNRLNWGEDCYDYEIKIEKVLYSDTDRYRDGDKMEIKLSDKSGSFYIGQDVLFRVCAGMDVVLFLKEKEVDGTICYEINQIYPFYVSERGYVVPASTFLKGYEEYGGMRIKKFMKEVKRAYQVVKE